MAVLGNKRKGDIVDFFSLTQSSVPASLLAVVIIIHNSSLGGMNYFSIVSIFKYSGFYETTIKSPCLVFF